MSRAPPTALAPTHTTHPLAPAHTTHLTAHAAAPQGEHVDTIEGVNAPALNKLVADYLPEGLVDVEVDEKGGEDDEDDE